MKNFREVLYVRSLESSNWLIGCSTMSSPVNASYTRGSKISGLSSRFEKPWFLTTSSKLSEVRWSDSKGWCLKLPQNYVKKWDQSGTVGKGALSWFQKYWFQVVAILDKAEIAVMCCTFKNGVLEYLISTVVYFCLNQGWPQPGTGIFGIGSTPPFKLYPLWSHLFLISFWGQFLASIFPIVFKVTSVSESLHPSEPVDQISYQWRKVTHLVNSTHFRTLTRLLRASMPIVFFDNFIFYTSQLRTPQAYILLRT